MLVLSKHQAMSLSVNTLNKSFSPTQDLIEKWDVTTFKAQSISEFKVLAGITNDSIVLLGCVHYEALGGASLVMCFVLKKLETVIELLTLLKCFFPVL